MCDVMRSWPLDVGSMGEVGSKVDKARENRYDRVAKVLLVVLLGLKGGTIKNTIVWSCIVVQIENDMARCRQRPICLVCVGANR